MRIEELLDLVFEQDPIPQPPAKAAEIAAFEKMIGITFPETFKAFLKRSNGGEFCFARMESPYVPDDLQDLTLPDLWERVIETIYPKHSALISRKLIPIGDDYAGNFFFFDYRGKGDPKIVILMNYAGENDEPELIARNFETFLIENLEA